MLLLHAAGVAEPHVMANMPRNPYEQVRAVDLESNLLVRSWVEKAPREACGPDLALAEFVLAAIEESSDAGEHRQDTAQRRASGRRVSGTWLKNTA
ncbi:MAG: hypothetical protein H5T86_06000 [Armatimonadetes bacterium]|nr:hypothetical protein [Armatimonadota bacterium]